MDLLLNYDDTRTSKYTESILVPSDGKYKLKYIPKEGSLSIQGFNIITSGIPSKTDALVVYKSPNQYFQATGVVEFNTLASGWPAVIVYTPIGSRIDADDLNPTLQWWANNSSKLYLKDDFKANGIAEVDWSCIKSAPGNATIAVDGFMSFIDKRTVLTVDPNRKPIGGITLDSLTWTPKAWGDNLIINDTSSIKLSLVNNALRFDVDPLMQGLVPKNILDALEGTGGTPGATNKYVTEKDDRFTATGIVPHEHTEAQVKNLVTDLQGKAPVSHTHPLTDVTTLVSALSDKAPVTHTHEILNITDLQTTLNGKAALLHTHPNLEIGIADKAKLDHKHIVADILDFSDYVNPTPQVGYESFGESTSLEDIIEDYTIEGYAVTPKADFVVSVAPGKQYANGIKVVNKQTTNLNTILSSAPTAMTTVPPTLYPIVSGAYNGKVPLTLRFKIMVPNESIMGLSGLVVNVLDGSDTLLTTLSYFSNTMLDIELDGKESGIMLRFSIDEKLMYETTYEWEVKFKVDQDVYVYLDGISGSCKTVGTDHGATMPTLPKYSSTIAKVITNTTGIASIVDMRPQSAPPKLKDVRAITQPANDSSTKIATTAYVKSNLVYQYSEEFSLDAAAIKTLTIPAPYSILKSSIALYTKTATNIYSIAPSTILLALNSSTNIATITNSGATTANLRIVIIGG